ncbi:MAG: hypothetical protein J6T10_14350 [Methanobrevibacter sp.]|nr:hypothetical protein [Methanobrevibacter sp.]
MYRSHYKDRARVIYFARGRTRDARYYLSQAKNHHNNMVNVTPGGDAYLEFARLQMKYETYLINCIQETISLLKDY